MSETTAARATTGRTRALLVVGLVTAGIVGAFAHQAGSSSAPPLDELPRSASAAPEADGAVTEADGVVPDGVTAFDDEYPGVANLDADLLQAVRQAATAAADDGVELYVNSGWRSTEYQDQLLREAVAEHGSAQAAARWVATPDTSPHISGAAIDIGHADGRAWLSEHGDEYGLCQIYLNEPWHYELRPEAVEGGCPAMFADTSHDPRMGL